MYEKALANNGRSFYIIEKATVLGCLDDSWKEHLRAMEDLKQSVQTAVWEQKDPLQIYKKEAYILFGRNDWRNE